VNRGRVIATIFVWLSWAAVLIALNTHSSPNITSTDIETTSIVASAVVVTGTLFVWLGDICRKGQPPTKKK